MYALNLPINNSKYNIKITQKYLAIIITVVTFESIAFALLFIIPNIRSMSKIVLVTMVQ